MSIAFQSSSVIDQEYASKSELHFGLRISYARIAQAIREGKIEMHLVDGAIKFRVKEVLEALGKKHSRSDLFGH
jgi:hypothetical protein